MDETDPESQHDRAQLREDVRLAIRDAFRRKPPKQECNLEAFTVGALWTIWISCVITILVLLPAVYTIESYQLERFLPTTTDYVDRELLLKGKLRDLANIRFVLHKLSILTGVVTVLLALHTPTRQHIRYVIRRINETRPVVFFALISLPLTTLLILHPVVHTLGSYWKPVETVDAKTYFRDAMYHHDMRNMHHAIYVCWILVGVLMVCICTDYRSRTFFTNGMEWLALYPGFVYLLAICMVLYASLFLLGSNL